MAQIVSKLNLNKTPSTVESNSLVFSKNIPAKYKGYMEDFKAMFSKVTVTEF